MDLADALTKMVPDAVMVCQVFYWTDSSDGWGTPAAFVNVQSNSQVNENDDKMLEFAFGSEASKSSSRVASKSGNPFLDFM